MLNHITLMGRLTRDPEVKALDYGYGITVANFTIAVDRDYLSKETGERETDFINCVAWRNTGEFVGRYFRKGSMIVVSGRLQIRKWVDNDGNNRTTAEVVAENVYFGESKRDKDARDNAESYQTSSWMKEYDDCDEELPF